MSTSQTEKVNPTVEVSETNEASQEIVTAKEKGEEKYTKKDKTPPAVKEITPPKTNGATVEKLISTRSKRSRDKDKDTESHKSNKFNVNQLTLAHLQRYRKIHKLSNVKVRSSREELVKAVSEHFKAIKVNEPELIASFIHCVSKKKLKVCPVLTE
ncbi:hypothetical protein DSO57_1016831 [Entomophthora muscae]|uniref:Uncharacterized protein n=1 Tax=Entomophthora muscae TaxID=34485 RepID=A0ACC2URQ5_9FUNG|nr:hypothetical protein DSO57_1016831 [Entomophthora muscae]